jgi:hypothetical protein
MSAAERKQRQRERQAQEASAREPFDAKLKRGQALAEQLLIAARNVAAKLVTERKVSVNAEDIARHLIGLGETEHVRQALEGKPVTPPPAQTMEPATTLVKPAPECALCFEEPKYFFQLPSTGKRIVLCKDCRESLRVSFLRISFSEIQPSDNVTSDVTQDDDTQGSALVWEYIDPDDPDGECLEAKAGRGVYTIMPMTDRSGRSLSGYRVTHWPNGTMTPPVRSLGVDVETVEEAKAIAQADHDEGKDAR